VVLADGLVLDRHQAGPGRLDGRAQEHCDYCARAALRSQHGDGGERRVPVRLLLLPLHELGQVLLGHEQHVQHPCRALVLVRPFLGKRNNSEADR
jgi:hypothetical protein